jgi:hypothetical protein
MDSSGRLRRLVIALLLGGAAAAAGYFVADSLAKPDEMAASGQHTMGSVARASQFVFYVAGLAGIVVFLTALTVQNKLADKKYREGLVAQAKVRR